MYKADPDFEALTVQLSKEEKDRVLVLAENGTIEKIAIWNNTVILGYEYLGIYRDHGIKLRYVHPELKDRADAILYAVNSQLQRKGLSREQTAYLIGKRYFAEKQAKRWVEREDFVRGRGRHSSAEMAAEGLDIKPKTVETFAKFTEHVDALAKTLGQSVKDQILSGKSGFSRARIERMSYMSPEDQRKEWAIGGGKTEEMLATCSDAIAFAITAISHLERIRTDDPHRAEAFAKVINWIKTHGGQDEQ